MPRGSVNLDINAIRPMVLSYLQNTANNIADDAKQKAPVRTGALRDSIHVRDTNEELRKEIVADTTYAIYVELGSAIMAAQPYLRPALYSVSNYRR